MIFLEKVPRECSKNCFGANVCLYSYKTRQKSLELSFDLISERNKEGNEVRGRQDWEVREEGICIVVSSNEHELL